MGQEASYGNCRICDGGNLRKVLAIQEKDVLRCWDCGVFYYWPLPTPDELKEVYDTEWADEEGEHCQFYHDPVAEELNLKKNFRPRLDLLAARGFSGTILDVGCSVGTFLKEAQARGWDVEGIDLGEEPCSKTAAALGCAVHEGTIETTSLPDATYDVIHASQVIEHTLDPKAFLASAHRLLKPGGALLLATPIIDTRVYYGTHHVQRAVIPVVSRGRMHPYPWGLYMPYHTFVQSTKSITLLLENQGFEIVYTKKFPWNAWHGMNLKWRSFYHIMNVVFFLLGTGQNIDILAVKKGA